MTLREHSVKVEPDSNPESSLQALSYLSTRAPPTSFCVFMKKASAKKHEDKIANKVGAHENVAFVRNVAENKPQGQLTQKTSNSFKQTDRQKRTREEGLWSTKGWGEVGGAVLLCCHKGRILRQVLQVMNSPWSAQKSSTWKSVAGGNISNQATFGKFIQSQRQI